jgi:nitrate reductase (cytochrome), electron transfer subunit
LKTNTLLVAGILLLAINLVSCSANNSKTEMVDDSVATEVADTELSYRNQPLMDPSFTPAALFESADPGDSKLLARAFENSPPLIPHNTDDLLPITIGDNSCLECHLPENAVDAAATPTPASHLYDIRRDKQLSGLNPANFNCTQCHANLANVDDLVVNTFEPYFRTDEGAEESNFLEILNDGVE